MLTMAVLPYRLCFLFHEFVLDRWLPPKDKKLVRVGHDPGVMGVMLLTTRS
jgi:hypothetical protein